MSNFVSLYNMVQELGYSRRSCGLDSSFSGTASGTGGAADR